MAKGNPNWKKGVSGNPLGRKLGYEVNPLTKALKEKSLELFNKALNMALVDNDKDMLKLLLDRCRFEVKGQININSKSSSQQILEDALEERSDGNIDNADLNSIVNAVNTRITAIESRTMDERLTVLESHKNENDD